jgi:hypothetical protein
VIVVALGALCVIAVGFLALGVAALVVAVKHQPQARVQASRTWESDREQVQLAYEGPATSPWMAQLGASSPPFRPERPLPGPRA